MVWTEDTSDAKDIVFSRSLDGGQTFQAPRNLSNTPGQSRQGRIAVNAAGTIFVVWDEGEAPSARHIAMSRRSFDGGGSFETPRPVLAIAITDSDFANPDHATYPGIAIDPGSGRLYLVWHDLVGGRPPSRRRSTPPRA